MFFPYYERSILSIVASILEHYRIVPPNGQSSLPELKISKDCNNIILMVFDGMGSDVISVLENGSFICSNKIADISSVYPCTTTSATRSIYSGLPPITHGYLGWNCYFKECGRNIAILKDQDFFSGETINFAQDYLSYYSIFNYINDKFKGEVATHHIMHFFEEDHISLDQIGEEISSICENGMKNFIVLYWDMPDALMHLHGPKSLETKLCLYNIDTFLKRIVSRIRKSTFIITADHGMKTINKCVSLNSETELMNCLYMSPSLEYRAMSLFVKPHMIDTFIDIFSSRFGNKYILLSRSEVFDKRLFGEGIRHQKIDDFLGNYLACGIADVLLYYASPIKRKHIAFKGHHSGLTKEEMLVPLIYYES